jgi:hypothetical protein
LNPASVEVLPGNLEALLDRMDFLTRRDALDFVRERWSSIQGRAPRIADVDHYPIYDAEELVQEIEG